MTKAILDDLMNNLTTMMNGTSSLARQRARAIHERLSDHIPTYRKKLTETIAQKPPLEQKYMNPITKIESKDTQ
jgi:ElaB/YqjD/DUF883 family membrane-anchored ribosome-binding protein